MPGLPGWSTVTTRPAQRWGRCHADNQLVIGASPISEPFRSDPAFWRSLRTGAYALVVVVACAAAGVALALTTCGALLLVPAGVAAVTVARAGVLAVRSSRSSRACFPAGAEGRRAWRDAERQAVAHGFLPALRGASGTVREARAGRAGGR